jgi:DNA mismatch repair protein MSH5
VLEYHEELLITCSIASELDCLIAFSVAAIQHNLAEPTLVNEPVLYIEKGRHPLCEAVVDVFVPNDTALDAERSAGAIHIITGPNSSGKSIYMKQVALVSIIHLSLPPSLSKPARSNSSVLLCTDHIHGSHWFLGPS